MVGKKTRNDRASCSILPAMAGLVPYENMSRNKVLSRAIRAKNGEDVNKDFNPSPAQVMAMELGDTLENVLLNKCVKTLGLTMPDLEVDYPVKHETLPLEGSMDGFAFAGDELRVEHDPDKGIYIMGSNLAEMSGKVILECKVTRDFPEEQPHLYRGVMQLQGLMDIEQADWGLLCVLYQSTTLRFFVYYKDEIMVKEIHELVKDFDYRVQNEVPYPPANPEEASSYWNQQETDAEPITLPDDALVHIERIGSVDKEMKRLKEEKDTSTAYLMSLLKENGKGIIDTIRGNASLSYIVEWPMRHYKSKPVQTIPAKEAYSIRTKTLKIKEIENETN